jgi:hypothetical protein
VAHERRPDLNALTGLLSAALSGDSSAGAQLARLDLDVVCRAAHHHGVLPLLADRIPSWPALPESFTSRFRDDASRHLAADLGREAELRRCLTDLDRAGIPALVMKGAHLAYRYYSRPDLRPRIDTDLLVTPDRRDDIDRILIAAGYARRPEMSGELVTSQAMYVKRQGDAVLHAVDVHWRVANPQVFAGVLTFDELSRDAETLPELGSTARGLSPVHALLMACVHRVAHHYDDDCLIWLYDIHLIASDLSADEWRGFLTLARDRSVVAVCRQGLATAREAFGTTWPALVVAEWTGQQPLGSEPTAAYLAGDRSLAEHLWIDLRALPSWSRRWQLIKEQVFPPARYMRDVYAPASAAPLPVLYTRRVLHGARKWLARF